MRHIFPFCFYSSLNPLHGLNYDTHLLQWHVYLLILRSNYLHLFYKKIPIELDNVKILVTFDCFFHYLSPATYDLACGDRCCETGHMRIFCIVGITTVSLLISIKDVTFYHRELESTQYELLLTIWNCFIFWCILATLY